MTLCTVALDIPNSWDSRLVDFRGDCSRCYLTASVPEFLFNVRYRFSALNLSPRKFPPKCPLLEPLIWLKSNFQESLSFRALKIDEPHPFWYQINSTGHVNSLSESKKKIFIFLENVNKEKWVDFCGPPCINGTLKKK